MRGSRDADDPRAWPLAVLRRGSPARFPDSRYKNFEADSERIPKLDMALSALVENLHARGLDRDPPVVVRGEFGRTLRINRRAGRDHWPPVNFALLAGSGMGTGQVIGSNDKHAAYAKDRPVSLQDVFATPYHNLGSNPGAVISDRDGRPMCLRDEWEAAREVI